ncbi:hypothetical protein BJY01DRAFT_251575 [Aspergillus pseudoustus]|uniref:Uncharacterized protein n=1 Tax=Aspergillus pseudoustus TaxID=1810923 RepID=A0ABR4JE53_9EURO
MNNDLSHITEKADEQNMPYSHLVPAFCRPVNLPRACEAKTRDEVAGRTGVYCGGFRVDVQGEQSDTRLLPDSRGQTEILEDLLRRPKEMEIDVRSEPCWIAEEYKIVLKEGLNYGPASMVPRSATLNRLVAYDHQWSHQYNESAVCMSPLELLVSVPEEWKKPDKSGNQLDVEQIYMKACYPDK